MNRKRWDNDTSYAGIADGAPVRGPVEALVGALTWPRWVTEDAEAHLGPHLRRACEATSSPWTWLGAQQQSDGVYVAELGHPGDANARLRDGVRLLACIAEPAFHVRQIDPATLECATGVLPGDSGFATHGHTVRLRIR